MGDTLAQLMRKKLGGCSRGCAQCDAQKDESHKPACCKGVACERSAGTVHGANLKAVHR